MSTIVGQSVVTDKIKTLDGTKHHGVPILLESGPMTSDVQVLIPTEEYPDDSYVLVVSDCTVTTDGATIDITLSTDNGTSYYSSTEYSYSGIRISAGDAGYTHATSGGTTDFQSRPIGNAATEAGYLELNLMYPGENNKRVMGFLKDYLINNVGESGFKRQSIIFNEGAGSVPVNAIKLAPSAGSIDGGTYAVWRIPRT